MWWHGNVWRERRQKKSATFVFMHLKEVLDVKIDKSSSTLQPVTRNCLPLSVANDLSPSTAQLVLIILVSISCRQNSSGATFELFLRQEGPWTCTPIKPVHVKIAPLDIHAHPEEEQRIHLPTLHGCLKHHRPFYGGCNAFNSGLGKEFTSLVHL